MTERHLISAAELRAAGALDVPPSWRKSLSVERQQYSLFGDDDADLDSQAETSDDASDDEPDEDADEMESVE